MEVSKIIVLLSLNTALLGITCGQSTTLKTTHDVRACIVTPDGKPTEQLTALFDYFNIKHDGSLRDMASKAAAAWLQPDNFNSRPTVNNPLLNNVKPLVTALGLLDAAEYTSQKHYKYAVVVGGFVSTIKSRLSYLKKFWDQGIRFDHLIFLTGQRDLHPERDSIKELCTDFYNGKSMHLPLRKDWKFDEKAPYKTEYDMIKMVYEQLDLPQQMRTLPVLFVNAQKTTSIPTQTHFPYKSGSLKAWLETKPEPGDCLVIVNQPYVLGLDAALRNLLPKDFKTIDVVGYAISPQFHSVELWLEALASFLYEECLQIQK